MTNEQLTELARQYAKDRYCSETNEMPKYKIAQIHAGRDGFIKGAKYMRNSPWHDSKYTPVVGRIMLIEDNTEKGFTVTDIKDINDYKTLVEYFGIKRWAYIEDLIPMED